jgi:hypothetical protein
VSEEASAFLPWGGRPGRSEGTVEGGAT